MIEALREYFATELGESHSLPAIKILPPGWASDELVWESRTAHNRGLAIVWRHIPAELSLEQPLRRGEGKEVWGFVLADPDSLPQIVAKVRELTGSVCKPEV